MAAISIHALREEGDPAPRYRAATGIHISIHALREEGDIPTNIARWQYFYFNPRPP